VNTSIMFRDATVSVVQDLQLVKCLRDKFCGSSSQTLAI
jgi:hypothetical protein